jgi:hypothetical protein
VNALRTALVASTLALSTVSPALADAPRSFDAKLPRPFAMSMRGVTSSEAWVAMTTRTGPDIEEGVVDLQTGCVVETIPRFFAVARLRNAHNANEAEALMADPAVRMDVARFVTAGRRFGRTHLGFGTIADDDVAFSNDGQTIVVEAGEAAFRSHDGGKTFDRLDANMSRFPAVTADGKWVFYERCADASRFGRSCPDASREVRIVASDNSSPPKRVAIGSGLLRGMDPSGQKLVVVRYDLPNEVTAMHVDPRAGTMTRAFGIASAPLRSNRFHDIEPSPKGSFGLFDDNDKAPMSVFTVASMTAGRIVQQFSVRNEMGAETDDESGRLMWQTYPDDHAWARRPGGSIVDLGMGDPIGWATGGRAIVFAATYGRGARVEEPAAPLGAVACKLVRVTSVR